MQRPLVDSLGRPLGADPESIAAFYQWFGDSKAVDGLGRPLVMYHGSDTEILEIDSRPMYFTPDLNYGYIRNSPYITEAFLKIDRLYRVDAQSEIESLAYAPDIVEKIMANGIDAVVWADRGNMTKGGTGWGNDSPQFMALDPRESVRICETPEPEAILDGNVESQVAYRGEPSQRSGPNFGSSGYYSGSYYFTGPDALERARSYGDIIESIDLGFSNLYRINNEADANELKALAKQAGLRTSDGSGHAEMSYLAHIGYDGVVRGDEVVILNPESLNARRFNYGATINVDGAQRTPINSEGRWIAESIEDTKSVWRFLGDKAVVDEEGRPVVVYRGEHGGDLPGNTLSTRLGSLSFGSRAAAQTYSEQPNNRNDIVVNPRVVAAYIKMEKSLMVSEVDPFIDLSLLVESVGLDRTCKIALELSQAIEATDNWQENYSDYQCVENLIDVAPEDVGGLYIDAYRVLDNPEFCGWLKEAGLDGCIHGGNGETALETEWKVWGEGLVMNADTLRCMDYTLATEPVISSRPVISLIGAAERMREFENEGAANKAKTGMGPEL